MTENNEMEEDLHFVVNHFKKGTLLPSNGWRKFKLKHRLSNYKRYIAAASITAVVLAASASLYYLSSHNVNSQREEQITEVIPTVASPMEATTAKIEFKNAPLTDVVAEIERIYGVKITNLPEERIMVTISYEGTALDVVETINDLFDTNLKIATTAN